MFSTERSVQTRKTSGYGASPEALPNGGSAGSWFFLLCVPNIVWGLAVLLKPEWWCLGDEREDSFVQSPPVLFFLVNATATGTRCCRTPAYGVIAPTWAAMRWGQVSVCRGNVETSLTRRLGRADKSLLIISTCLFKLQMWFLQN